MARAYTSAVTPVLLNRISIGLSFIGLYIAGLLSLEKAINLQLPCGSDGGCIAVANHPSAFIIGIPVAYLGLLGYALLAFIAMGRALQGMRDTEALVNLGTLLSCAGMLFSFYLQFISFTVIKHTCPYCIASAVIMTALFVVHLMLRSETARQPALAPAADGEAAPIKPPSVDKDLLFGVGMALFVAFLLAANMYNMRRTANNTSAVTVNTDQLTFVPEHANVYGDKNAPITLVEFADMQCPSCQAMSPQLKEFVDKYPGRVRLVYRHFPLDQIHPLATIASSMAEYAADQGKFWEFKEAVIAALKGHTPEDTTVDMLLEAARAVGLDEAEMSKRIVDPKDPIAERLAADRRVVDALGIDSTPTFIVLAPNMAPQAAKVAAVFNLLREPEYQRILDGK